MPPEAPNTLFTSNSATNRPRGRPKGSRSKLATRFFEDVYAAWEEQGSSVIARAFFHDPVASMNMVARLMPQKIEHSVPTDGLSDERLGELLDYAERMAGLKATQAIEVQARVLTDEKGRSGVVLEGPGGGALSQKGGGGENTSSTLRPEPGGQIARETNRLVEAIPLPKGFSAVMPHGEAAPTRRAPIGQPKTVVARPSPPEAPTEHEGRPPVGKPAKDPIDPADLF